MHVLPLDISPPNILLASRQWRAHQPQDGSWFSYCVLIPLLNPPHCLLSGPTSQVISLHGSADVTHINFFSQPCMPLPFLPWWLLTLVLSTQSAQPNPSASPPCLAQAFPNCYSYHSDSYPEMLLNSLSTKRLDTQWSLIHAWKIGFVLHVNSDPLELTVLRRILSWYLSLLVLMAAAIWWAIAKATVICSNSFMCYLVLTH